MRTYKLENRGQAIVLVAIAMIVLIALVGLAIDGGISYGVKVKLSSAADAAAIAAGRALGEGVDDNARIANAVAAATKFFNANFPSGYLRATPSTPNIDVCLGSSCSPTVPPGTWRITVTATATVPTFFLRIIGNNTFTAAATAETLRRDLEMAFVIDNTGSIAENPADPQRVRDAAIFFVGFFSPASDRMALLRFAFGAEVMDQVWGAQTNLLHPPPSRGFDKTSIVNHINSMTFDGNTNFSEAFWRGWDQLDSIPLANRSSLRAIVFFSDGSPNSFTSTFHHPPPPVVTDHTGVIASHEDPGDSRNGGNPFGLWEPGNINNDSSAPWNFQDSSNLPTYVPTLPRWFDLGAGMPTANGRFPVWPVAAGGPLKQRAVPSPGTDNYANVNNAARNLPEYMANEARNAGIYVFTLGLGQRLTELSGQNNERGDTVLKRMANDPSSDTYNSSQPAGLYCFAPDATQLRACFTAIANQILRLTK